MDSVRLPYLPDWIKESDLKKAEERRAFIEQILAEALHRQSIYPGRVGDRTLSVSYTGHYWLEEVRSDKLNLKSWRDWLYTKDCWRKFGYWVEAPPKNERYANGAKFILYGRDN